MRKLMVVGAVLMLAGCGSAVEESAKAVLLHLDNPKTARFTNVRTTDKGDVCGQVRQKDASGKFEGYRNYAAIKTEDGFKAVIDEDGNNAKVREVCGEGQEVSAEDAAPAAAATAAHGWEVQIVDGANMGALSDMTSRLIENGFVASVAQRDGKQLVYLGPFQSKEEAEQKRAQLLASQGIKSVVVEHQAN
ncbi:sporulation domain-containing protein [Pseudomonas sp. M47T1]|uniref:SPOR domain-containing protein n=1 Tax=unclassified Pseudomonas TaxID=196821 RepID=UPI0002608687|nr:SPOR domain-containing protein [Pseudomonas sp. M47T1]EIK93286.1 sporulation domain-containing protein [Pseudomonas sp. M47T1]